MKKYLWMSSAAVVIGALKVKKQLCNQQCFDTIYSNFFSEGQ